jgi:bacteriorhodopsin
MEIDYLGALIQWSLFFAICSCVFVPAFILGKAAKKHNEKGWLYFIVGFGIGAFCLVAGAVMINIIASFSNKDVVLYSVVPVIALVCFLLYSAIKNIKGTFKRNQS